MINLRSSFVKHLDDDDERSSILKSLFGRRDMIEVAQWLKQCLSSKYLSGKQLGESSDISILIQSKVRYEPIFIDIISKESTKKSV